MKWSGERSLNITIEGCLETPITSLFIKELYTEIYSDLHIIKQLIMGRRGLESSVQAFRTVCIREKDFMFWMTLHSQQVEWKVQRLSICSLPHIRITSPIINTLRQSGIFTIDKPTLTSLNHSKSIVYTDAHSWCFASGQIHFIQWHTDVNNLCA